MYRNNVVLLVGIATASYSQANQIWKQTITVAITYSNSEKENKIQQMIEDHFAQITLLRPI